MPRKMRKIASSVTVRAKPARRRENRVDQDAQRQRARTAPAIGDDAEQDAAGRRRGQRDRSEQPARGAIHAEIRHQRRQDEGVQHDVERVEEPAEGSCEEGATSFW